MFSGGIERDQWHEMGQIQHFHEIKWRIYLNDMIFIGI